MIIVINVPFVKESQLKCVQNVMSIDVYWKENASTVHFVKTTHVYNVRRINVQIVINVKHVNNVMINVQLIFHLIKSVSNVEWMDVKIVLNVDYVTNVRLNVIRRVIVVNVSRSIVWTMKIMKSVYIP